MVYFDKTLLGPFLYEIYISPLFDLEDFHAFADDNQVIGENANLVELIDDMELRLEMMTKILDLQSMKRKSWKTHLDEQFL